MVGVSAFRSVSSMKTQYRIVFTLLGLACLAFPALAPAQKAAGFLNKSEATKLFPRQLLEYKLKDVKIKPKADDWQEYSATYKTTKTSPKELKLVINDSELKDFPRWGEQRDKATGKTQGFPSKLEKGADKHTVMVFVGDRFRVDFKSTTISPEKLQAMAEKFAFKAVAALDPTAGN